MDPGLGKIPLSVIPRSGSQGQLGKTYTTRGVITYDKEAGVSGRRKALIVKEQINCE